MYFFRSLSKICAIFALITLYFDTFHSEIDISEVKIDSFKGGAFFCLKKLYQNLSKQGCLRRVCKRFE